ncbi:hypothetical protein N7490_007938 [Penicillium lividum]|nr:hypothetical protein N7490_007938 [Penicillium lividum]
MEETEDLARIRNNQRKCRERRRDYIAELEQKLKYHEDESVKRNTELQATIQELHCENEVLRKSLGISGTSGEYPYWFDKLYSTKTSGSWCGNIRSDDLNLEAC